MDLLKKALLVASFAMVAIPVANALTIDFDDRTDNLVLVVDGNPSPIGGEGVGVGVGGIAGVFTGVNVRFIIRDPNTTNVSDIMSVLVTPNASAGTTAILINFQSDAEASLTYVPNPTIDEIISETGAFQTVYFGVDALNGTNTLTFRFASDAERTVPEPATLALLGLGLAGLGFSRRKH